MWTIEFDRFVAPARARRALWRLIAGAVLTLAIYAAAIAALLGTIWAVAGQTALVDWMQRIALADTPTAVILLLATFLGMMLGPMAAVRLLHGRGIRTLFGEGLLVGFVTAGVITALVFAASFLLPAPFVPVANTPPGVFLAFLPLAVVGLLVQTGAEEVLFRGYLQQQLAARFDMPLAWMLLPALLFGALHFDPANAGPNAPLLVASATLFGLVAADLTRVTGSIGAAWGVHFVNNAAAILLVGLDGSLSGLSLWKTPFGAADTELLRPLILQDLLVTVIVWACVRLWLARRGAA